MDSDKERIKSLLNMFNLSAPTAQPEAEPKPEQEQKESLMTEPESKVGAERKEKEKEKEGIQNKPATIKGQKTPRTTKTPNTGNSGATFPPTSASNIGNKKNGDSENVGGKGKNDSTPKISSDEPTVSGINVLTMLSNAEKESRRKRAGKEQEQEKEKENEGIEHKATPKITGSSEEVVTTPFDFIKMFVKSSQQETNGSDQLLQQQQQQQQQKQKQQQKQQQEKPRTRTKAKVGSEEDVSIGETKRKVGKEKDREREKEGRKLRAKQMNRTDSDSSAQHSNKNEREGEKGEVRVEAEGPRDLFAEIMKGNLTEIDSDTYEELSGVSQNSVKTKKKSNGEGKEKKAEVAKKKVVAANRKENSYQIRYGGEKKGQSGKAPVEVESVPIALVATSMPSNSNDANANSGTTRALGVSERYICYGKKLGDIRIIDKANGATELFKGHENDVRDIQIHNNQLVASTDKDNVVIVWEVSPTFAHQKIKMDQTVQQIEWITMSTSDEPHKQGPVLVVVGERSVDLLVANGPAIVATKQISIDSKIQRVAWVQHSNQLLIVKANGTLLKCTVHITNNNEIQAGKPVRVLSLSSDNERVSVDWIHAVTPHPHDDTQGGYLVVSRTGHSAIDLVWMGVHEDDSAIIQTLSTKASDDEHAVAVYDDATRTVVVANSSHTLFVAVSLVSTSKPGTSNSSLTFSTDQIEFKPKVNDSLVSMEAIPLALDSNFKPTFGVGLELYCVYSKSIQQFNLLLFDSARDTAPPANTVPSNNIVADLAVAHSHQQIPHHQDLHPILHHQPHQPIMHPLQPQQHTLPPPDNYAHIIQSSVNAVLNSPEFKQSVADSVAQSLSAMVRDHIEATVSESIRSVLIPAYSRATSEMVNQIRSFYLDNTSKLAMASTPNSYSVTVSPPQQQLQQQSYKKSQLSASAEPASPSNPPSSINSHVNTSSKFKIKSRDSKDKSTDSFLLDSSPPSQSLYDYLSTKKPDFDPTTDIASITILAAKLTSDAGLAYSNISTFISTLDVLLKAIKSNTAYLKTKCASDPNFNTRVAALKLHLSDTLDELCDMVSSSDDDVLTISKIRGLQRLSSFCFA